MINIPITIENNHLNSFNSLIYYIHNLLIDNIWVLYVKYTQYLQYIRVSNYT